MRRAQWHRSRIVLGRPAAADRTVKRSAYGRLHGQEQQRGFHGRDERATPVWQRHQRDASFPRIAATACKYKLRGGCSLDLTTPDTSVYVWDFSQRNSAGSGHGPRSGSIGRTYSFAVRLARCLFSILQNVQRIKLGGHVKLNAAIERAKVHVEFCC